MKIKNLILLGLFGLQTITGLAQKYATKVGKTDFRASVEAFEKVEATNKSTSAVLDSETGKIAALLFVRAFKFKVALMEEHFNENYMDSDKFPKATFKGTLENFDVASLSNKDQKVKANGVLNIKGISKKIETMVSLKKSGSNIIAKFTFDVKPQDFNIEIPQIVAEKIAKKIIIEGNYELVKK